MPLHEWKEELNWLYPSFHVSWLGNLRDSLNAKLPPEYYAILERNYSPLGDGCFFSGVIPPLEAVESDEEYCSRKKNIISIRGSAADEVVAAVDVLVPGDKSNATRCEKLVDKATGLLSRGIHLLLVDSFPTSDHAPDGIHPMVWNKAIDSDKFAANATSRVAVSYECVVGDIQAYIEPLAVESPLPEVPVFLQPGGCVMLNLEETYMAAYQTVPARWRRVIEA